MTKVEELLERLLRVDKTPLYCAQGECGFTEGKHIPTRAELEELISVVAQQTQNQYKEALANVTEAYLKEGIRRCSAALKQGVAEGAEGVMSCPLYTHGWANDDDRRGEVHCCDRKGHEMSWNPKEMEQELKRANIDPASVLAPTKEKP